MTASVLVCSSGLHKDFGKRQVFQMKVQVTYWESDNIRTMVAFKKCPERSLLQHMFSIAVQLIFVAQQ